jgi:putative aminopeptidase FrvX
MPAARRATPLAEITRAIVSQPTTSYAEHRVAAAIRVFADARGLDYHEDEFGNGYVEYHGGRRRPPLVLGAHTDHPGFVVTVVRGRRLTLEFRGGLSADYGRGERVRIYSPSPVGAPRDGGHAEVTSVAGRARVRGGPKRIATARATLEAGATAEVGDIAVWDVPACSLRGEIVHARQCDDLIGVVSILATIDRLWASRGDGHVIGLFTRAEEVGLTGAAAAAGAHTLPDDSLVVAVETSSMAGGRAEQGGGPIIRVGDAQHIFSSAMTLWMTEVARELAAADRGYRFQRKLMDGGTTEATAYDLMGYTTGAACVALGNFHNAGPQGRVRAETVSLSDVDGLARLFERMARRTDRFAAAPERAAKRWRQIAREVSPRLRATR